MLKKYSIALTLPSRCGGVLDCDCVSPSSSFLLANTSILIPAPSTLSAGGHRRLPPPFPSSSSPCFWTHSCLGNGLHLGEIEPLELCLLKPSSESRGSLMLPPDLRPTFSRDSPLESSRADTLLRIQCMFTRGMIDLSFGLCIGFFSAVPMSVIPCCALKSAALSLVSSSETLQWYIIRGEGLMGAGFSETLFLDINFRYENSNSAVSLPWCRTATIFMTDSSAD